MDKKAFYKELEKLTVSCGYKQVPRYIFTILEDIPCVDYEKNAIIRSTI